MGECINPGKRSLFFFSLFIYLMLSFEDDDGEMTIVMQSINIILFLIYFQTKKFSILFEKLTEYNLTYL